MRPIKLGTTDRTVLVYIPDSASTTGAGKTGLNAAALTVSYTRVETDNDVVNSDVTSSLSDLSALTDTHTDWGVKEVSSTKAPGLYRLDLADAVFAAGAWTAVVYVCVTSGLAAASPIEFELVAYDPLDGTRLGLTALPNAAADAAGGLPISDAGGLDLDAQRSDVAAILVDTGTTLDGRIPAALVSGRMDASVGAYQSGQAPLQPTTAGRALDVSAAGNAGIDWSNVEAPTTTLNLSGTTISTSQAVASVSGAVGSVTGAVASVTGAVGSVTGNVGGNVTGSIGSVASGGISSSSFSAGAITAAVIATDAIDADALAADAVSEIQSGLATSANQTTILARLGSWTGSGLNTILGALRAIAAKASALTPTDISSGTTFDNTTDSLEAVRDNQSAGGGATAQQVWEYASRTLTGSSTVTVVSPLDVNTNTLTLVQGDDYSPSDTGRTISWSSTGWPDLTSATVTFTARDATGTALITKAMSVTTPTGTAVVTLTLTASDTNVAVGQYRYDVQATLATSARVVTLALGTCIVLQDIT